jgi:prepilin-type processing-associated H-X9-DG protein
MYYCPSDRANTLWRGDVNWRCRGNYVLNWGPHRLFTANSNAPFGWATCTSFTNYTPYQRTLTDFTDGTANTLLMSETRVPITDAEYDVRGDFFNDRGQHWFMTAKGNSATAAYNAADDLTPNTTVLDQASDNGNPVPANGACNSKDPTMPCSAGTSNWGAARSRHAPGGVNAVFGDGSVKFIPNAVDPVTWRALSTIRDPNGTEVIGTY